MPDATRRYAAGELLLLGGGHFADRLENRVFSRESGRDNGMPPV
jgi:hypothetical protein